MANTAVPTVSAIVSSGATPIFVDVNESSFLMNIDDVLSKISSKTKAIILTD